MNEFENIVRELSTYPAPFTALENIEIPYTVLGYGSARIVIQDPNNHSNVIKIGVGAGIRQNKTEIELYEISDKYNFKSLLLPILDFCPQGKWIKMPKLEKPGKGLKKFEGPESEKVYHNLESKGVQLYEIETAYYKGDAVAIDYGALKSFTR